MEPLERVDRAQKATKPTSVAVATFKKFTEDKSTNMASMIAFWAFFSVFPLLLVFITLLGWFLPAGDKASVLGHVSSLFPLLDPSTVGALSGSWWALVVGAVTALWSGLSVVNKLQFSLNSVWEMPYVARPGMVDQLKRSLLVLVTVGGGFVVTTLVSGFVIGASNGVSLGLAGHIAGYVFSLLLDVGLMVAAFRMLTERDLSTRDVLPGAILSGVAFFLLQELSSFIISRHLQSAQSTYGHFATVITILWWFYIQSIVTLLGAQLNAVRKDRLYPRSLVDAPQTGADHRALQAYAAERTYQEEEEVQARVAPRPGSAGERPGRGVEAGHPPRA